MSETKSLDLFSLTNLFNQYMEVLERRGGELTDEEAKELEKIEKSLLAKADGYHFVMKRLESEADFFKTEAKRLTDYSRAFSNATDRLKKRLFEAVKLAEGNVISGDTVEFGLKKNPPSLVIDDAEEVKKEYLVVVHEIDKERLKADLKAGKEVKGARLVSGESLKIGRPRK